MQIVDQLIVTHGPAYALKYTNAIRYYRLQPGKSKIMTDQLGIKLGLLQ